MKITNDRIEFNAADFAALSDFAQKALSELFRKSEDEPGDYAAEFETILSNYVSRAKDELKQNSAKSDPTTDSILAGLASADEAKRLEAEPLLAQLDALLKS